VKTTRENCCRHQRRNLRVPEHVSRMIADAQAEGNAKALQSFNYANEVEKIHARCIKRRLTPWRECRCRLLCLFRMRLHREGEAPMNAGLQVEEPAFHKAE